MTDTRAALTAPAELPRTTATGRHMLARFAAAQDAGEPVHVYRADNTDRPGNGVSRPALDRLRRDGLVLLGERIPYVGQPVLVTDLGWQLLGTTTEA
jgi:hypothetical protein